MDQPQTVTAEALLLRLITSREYIDPAEGQRLLAEHRDQVLTEVDELIQAHRSSVHATRAGLDRARELIRAARATQES